MRVQSRFDSKKIGELVCDGAWKYVQNFAVEIDGDRVAEYKSLDKVASEWKDYEPTEPLIKDEKIRKAVRVLANIENVNELYYYYNNSECTATFSDGLGDKVCIVTKKFKFCDYWKYTIAELCGEEE